MFFKNTDLRITYIFYLILIAYFFVNIYQFNFIHWSSMIDHDLYILYNSLLISSGLEQEGRDHPAFFTFLVHGYTYKFIGIFQDNFSTNIDEILSSKKIDETFQFYFQISRIVNYFINFFLFLAFLKLIKFLKIKKINLPKNYYQKKIKDFDKQIKHYYMNNKFKNISNLEKNQAGPGNLILIDILTRLPSVKSVIETGVGLGYSSSTILSNLSKKKGSLISIDMPYLNVTNLNYLGSVVKRSLKKKWNLIIGIDYFVLKKLENQKKKFDLIIYDSDKSYNGRLNCYEILWKMLNKKGYFFTDDVADNDAFIDFAKKKNSKYFIIKKFKAAGGYSGIITKNR